MNELYNATKVVSNCAFGEVLHGNPAKTAHPSRRDGMPFRFENWCHHEQWLSNGVHIHRGPLTQISMLVRRIGVNAP